MKNGIYEKITKPIYVLNQGTRISKVIVKKENNEIPPILSNVLNGWCDFQIGEDICFTASYLTNVPLDVLAAILDYSEKLACSVTFDGEGFIVSLLITETTTFILVDDNEYKCFVIDCISPKVIIKNLFYCIKDNVSSWAKFLVDYDGSNEKELENENLKKIKEIENVYSNL